MPKVGFGIEKRELIGVKYNRYGEDICTISRIEERYKYESSLYGSIWYVYT